MRSALGEITGAWGSRQCSDTTVAAGYSQKLRCISLEYGMEQVKIKTHLFHLKYYPFS
jgi:hypothetical protein